MDEGVWTIPADKMKAGREHRVPLSKAAKDILASHPRLLGCPYIFPSPKNKQMSDMTISAVMRRMKEAEVKAGRPGFLDARSRRPAVPHGLHSSFRGWAAEHTHYPRDMAEMALVHNVGNTAERAYRRGDMVEKRRDMMEEWSSFLIGPHAQDQSTIQHFELSTFHR